MTTLAQANAHSTQGNSLCGDSITVSLLIQDECVYQYAYSGEPAPITKASAEFLGEFIIGASLQDILHRDAQRVKAEGFEVSHRRIRSSVSALLAARNAIHDYLDDGIIDEYEDLIE